MEASNSRPIAVLRIGHVKSRTGLSRSSIYALVRRGDFPPQISLGPRSVGWLDSEIDDWISRRLNARDQSTPAVPPSYQHVCGSASHSHFSLAGGRK